MRTKLLSRRGRQGEDVWSVGSLLSAHDALQPTSCFSFAWNQSAPHCTTSVGCSRETSRLSSLRMLVQLTLDMVDGTKGDVTSSLIAKWDGAYDCGCRYEDL